MERKIERAFSSVFLLTILLIILIPKVNATACFLNVSLINQDPYPAVPGDYVKIVFQITGTENPECGSVFFELLSEYPISFDPNTTSKIQIKGGTFTKDYSPYFMVPYKVRIDSGAIEGDIPINVKFGKNEELTDTAEKKQFTIKIEDVKVDFEVHVKNYDSSSKKATFEILNIGKSDIEALTLEIPKQENVKITGANKNIVGALDSNDYTTADFEAELNKGEINIILYYTDKINERRSKNETIIFDPADFEASNTDVNQNKYLKYAIMAIVVMIAIYLFHRRRKR